MMFKFPGEVKQMILIADDSEVVRTYISRMLIADGFEVISAEDGKKALEIFVERSAEIKLVITDLQMPEMDGLILCQRIRTISPNMSVLLLSGSGGVNDGGFSGYLMKPFKRQDLSGLVRKLLLAD